MLNTEAIARSITLVTTIADDEAPMVADAERLRQAFANVVANAIKFSDTGGRVDVTFARSDGWVRVEVVDRGTGIAPEFLSQIFTPFHQEETGTSRRRDGLGLGLAIARHVVELHGGRIRVTSAGPGLGATFTLELPIEARDAQVEPAPLGADGSDTESLIAARVLVVEDDASLRAGVVAALQNAGAEVRPANTVADAWELIARWQPDVVVSDLVLPDDDGVVLIRRLRESEQAARTHRPALALTGSGRPGDRARALEAGFDDFVVKPVAGAELIERVARLVAATTARKANAPIERRG